MSTHWFPRLSRRQSERLLDGGAPGARPTGAEQDDAAPLRHLLDAAQAPAQPTELAREDAAVAMFRAARLDPVPVSRRENVPSSPLARSLARLAALKAVIATVAAVLLMSSGIALAASHQLPWQKSHTPVAAADDSSDPGDPESTDATDEATDDETDDPSDPDDSTTAEPGDGPSPSLVGLCRAYQNGNKGEHGHALENPAFQALFEAAGGEENVDAFCTELLAAAHPEHSGGPSDDASHGHAGEHGHAGDHPTGKPSDHPTGKPSDHPGGRPSGHPSHPHPTKPSHG